MFKRKDQWNLCHPVNIYVYKNGVTREAATLVHIPGDMKKNMKSALQAIQARVKFPVGYPTRIYYTNGLPVCRTTELQMYEEYVVMTSVDTRFRCAEYGRPRSPLLVIGGEYSKHIRSICVNNNSFNMFNINRRKNEDKKSKYSYAYSFEQDGYGPTELPYINNSSKECGNLCQNVKRCVDCKKPNTCQPTQPPTTALSQFPAYKNPDEDGFYKQYKNECEPVPVCPGQPLTQEMGVSTDFATQDNEFQESAVDSEHLLAFINRYRDIGGQLYRMFHEKMTEDSPIARQDFNGETDDHTWYAEHLFGMFINRIEEKESDKQSWTDSTKQSNSFGSGSKSSGKSLEFDNISDSRTGVVASSSPNVNQFHQYPPEETDPKISLSILMKNRAAPDTGSTKPKNNTNSNNVQVYHTSIEDQNISKVDYYLTNKEDVIKKRSKYSFQKLRDGRHLRENFESPSRQNSGNNNRGQWSYVESVEIPVDNFTAMDEAVDMAHASDDDQDSIHEIHSPRQRPVGHHPLPDEEQYGSFDEFERFRRHLEYELQSPRQSHYDTGQRQQRTTLGRPEYIRRSERSRPSKAFPRSLETFEPHNENPDDFQILHHHRIHARPERQRLRASSQYQNARLLIPTYDDNGNFMHYVFQ